MIIYLQGNILNTPAITIVNTVNTVGVMGKGIALSVKNRYQELFEKYQAACMAKEFHVGQLMYYKAVDHDVLLFPTKAHWRYPSRLKWIEDGLKEFCMKYEAFGIKSIAFPKLGCGSGGLKWDEVKPIMEKYLNPLPITVYIYTEAGPNPAWEDKPIKNYTEWLHSIALDFDESALLQRFSEYLMIPYEFIIHGEKYNMLYMPGEIHISSNDISIRYCEQEFISLWEEWKSIGIIPCNESKKAPLLGMLKTMRYLEPIIIEETGNNVDGYQMLLMNDRAAKNEKSRRENVL